MPLFDFWKAAAVSSQLKPIEEMIPVPVTKTLSDTI
jgi:hypothetical protein